jgi:mono/diheme cytochrome c family protein
VKATLTLTLALLLVLLAGCDNMVQQRRADEYETSRLFANGMAMQHPPQGTLARDQTPAVRPAMTLAFVERGRERYEIYCTPCHAYDGGGAGEIVARGFPRPPDLAGQRLRGAPDDHLYDVIGNGYGVMYPFADRVVPADRWAIVAYVRALQRTRGGEDAGAR